MSYYLFLDDIRAHPDICSWIVLPKVFHWDIVRNYQQFVDHVNNNGIPKFVTFDHDLCDEHYQAYDSGEQDYGNEKTGYECAKFLVEYCVENVYKFPEYAVHSMNPVGKERIIKYIENAKTHLNI